MSEAAKAPGESVMAGGGYYSSHSQVQQLAAAPGLPLLERAAHQVPIVEGTAVVIGDFGCAGGRNELEPIRIAVAALRERAAVPITVVHTDLPSNDFASLFQAVEQSDASYLVGQRDVYAYAAGRSLYGPIFPAGGLALGWTAITVHWLSAMPCVVPDQVYGNLTEGRARDALRAQSRRDWEAFLCERARELRPGGQVVVVGGASRSDGSSGAEGLFELSNEELLAMVADGELRRSEYQNIFYPTWNRTLQEFLEPFEGGAFAGALAVEEHVEHTTWDAASYPQYEQDRDAAAFAEAYVPFVRAITAPSFFRWIEPDRSKAERALIEDGFYDGLKRRIAADPAKATCHWHTVSLRIRKTD
jgi:SAM dependent carboxyl methyltransferase